MGAVGKSTINDVARVAGVSKKTVSRVINRSPLLSTAMRARVQAAIDELAFVPSAQARALALRRNFLCALVYVAGREDGLAALIEGMSAALEGSEFALILRGLAQDRAAMASGFGRFLDEHRPFAVVLVGGCAADPALAALAGAAGCRLARLDDGRGDGSGDGSGDEGDADGSGDERDADGTGDGHDVDDAEAGPDLWLAVDERAATAAAVEWLVSLGHRRIGLIVGAEDSAAARARELGFLDALAENGLDRGFALIANGDDGFASGIDEGRLLLEVSPPPTAILAGSVASAAGVIEAARALGLAVPGDLSVTGLGDGACARDVRPHLTTIAPPLARMARLATLTLIDPLAPPPPRGLAAEITIRDSTAPPRELELLNPLPGPRAASG